MNVHSLALTLPLLQSYWWYVGLMAICLFVELFFGYQTTRIKGIIPKGLEVELELLGVKGMQQYLTTS